MMISSLKAKQVRHRRARELSVHKASFVAKHARRVKEADVQGKESRGKTSKRTSMRTTTTTASREKSIYSKRLLIRIARGAGEACVKRGI